MDAQWIDALLLNRVIRAVGVGQGTSQVLRLSTSVLHKVLSFSTNSELPWPGTYFIDILVRTVNNANADVLVRTIPEACHG
jgi:hypothetical protein